jgi:RND family efflux transporter MFP subunit
VRLSLLGVILAAAAGVWAQGPPASPVRYTEAREHAVRRTLRLPGTVESPTVSLVASEVAGVVAEFSVREGQRVQKEEPLARLRTESLELRRVAAQAQLKEAESRLKLAERNLERARELFDAKVISQQQLDDAFYESTAWQGRVEQLTADIATINLALRQSTIRAPFSGAITRERTQVGAWVGIGDPVVEMMSLEVFEVRVEVPEQHYGGMRAGASAQVIFPSLQGMEVAGKVSAVVPKADAQARTFPLKVRIPNRGGRIGAGMLVEVALASSGNHRATIVPKDAVVRRGPQDYVYVLNGDNTVSLAPVQTGEGVGAWVEVQSGLSAGQKVVTRGNERLRPGQAVTGTPLEYPLP